MQKLGDINVKAAGATYPFCPESTGDWAQDNNLGRTAATELAAYVKQTDDVPMLGLVLSRMYADNSTGTSGVRAGFTYAIATMIVK